MKRVLLLVFVFCAVVSLSAQHYAGFGIYGEFGIAVGGAWTSIDGIDPADVLDANTNLGVDVSLKGGFDISGNRSLYLVGEISGVGHRFADVLGSNYYVQYNSYLIGPGLVFYPHPGFQLSGSIGYSWTANTTDIPYVSMYDGNGIAFNVAGAVDVGMGHNGLLVGLKYHYSNNSLESSAGDMSTSFFGAFVRYRFKN